MLSILPRTLNQHTIVYARLNCATEDSEQLNTYLQTLLGCMGFEKQSCFMVTVCIAEAINNIIEHGGTVTCSIRCVFTIYNNYINVIILDSGKAYTPPNSEIKDIKEENGRGWHILRSWTNSIQYQRKSRINRLSLKFLLK